MLGDVEDFVSRARQVLPTRWFADVAPLGDAVLSGFGAAWSAIYSLIEAVRAQARLLTATGVFIDMISADYFGTALPRRAGESDGALARRIGYELLRLRGTRQAMTTAMRQLTGTQPVIFEPARPADTGGYNAGGTGYGLAGGYGSLTMPYQVFVTLPRPPGAGIPALAGYDSGGPLAYGSLAGLETAVSDADVYAAAAAVLPAGYTAWVQIRG